MRIRTLYLSTFGPFTNEILDFSKASASFHLIYGNNEAGKSSARRALDALFGGIPRFTRDNFLHDNAQLRVGAHLCRTDAQELSFFRRKGNKTTFLDSQDNPLPDTILQEFLAGWDVGRFLQLHVINHEELVQGGKDLLEAKGDLGQSLFDAGMGGVRLLPVIEALDDEAGGLFKSRARSGPEILKSIEAFKAAREATKQLSGSSKEWMEHDRALRDAKTQLAAITRELGRLHNEKEKLERIRKALPKIAQHTSLRDELAPLASIVSLRPDFAEERREVVRALQQAHTDETRARQVLAGIACDIEALDLHDDLLQQAEAITALHQRLGSHRKASTDRGGLASEQKQLLAQAQDVLHSITPGLELTEIDSLRLTEAEKVRIRELGERYQSLSADRRHAEDEVKRLATEVGVDQQGLDKMPLSCDPKSLKRLVARVRKAGDLEKHYRAAVAGLHRAEKQSQVALKKLGLWSGSLDDLEGLPIPSPETLRRFEKEFDHMATQQIAQARQVEQAQKNRKKLDRSLAQLHKGGAIPTQTDLETARQQRDESWLRVRAASQHLPGNAAGEDTLIGVPDLLVDFEQRMAAADDIADRLRLDADRVAKYTDILEQRETHESDLVALTQHQAQLSRETAALQAAWRKEWDFLADDPHPPPEMQSWIQAHQALTERAGHMGELSQEVDHLRHQIDQHRATLNQLLQDLGSRDHTTQDDDTLEALLERCDTIVETVEADQTRRQQLEQAISQKTRQLDGANQTRQEVQDALMDWRTDWEPAVVKLGLDAAATPNQANAVLDRVQDLFVRQSEAESLRLRIEGIQADAEAFEKEVLNVVMRLELPETPVEDAVTHLVALLNQARENQATLVTLENKKQDYDLIEIQSRLREKSDQLAALCREASCPEESPDQLEAVERRSYRKQELERELEQIDKQLLELGDGLRIDQIISEAEGMAPEAMHARRPQIENELQGLDNQRSELNQQMGREEAELRKMDGNSRALEAEERAQSLLATIQDQTDRFMRLRLAATVLRQEIERYRQQNQDPVLKRAGQLFNHLTRGSFMGLDTDFGESDDPVLIGVRPDERKVRVDGMSDGTRDQLYLALRLASLEKALGTSEPMPLIVDDILINFDDDRSQACVEVLAELAQHTQILCFTHHARLVEMAQRTVANGVLQIHQLGETPC